MRRVLLITVFISVLLAVLVGGHLYLAQKLVWGPALPAPWSDLVLIVLAFGALTLVLQPIGERLLAPPLGRVIAWPASLWMGTAFFLVVGGLLTDLLGLLGGAMAVGPASGATAGRLQAALIVALGFAAAGRGLREVRRGPELRRETVELPRWPAALDGFRIVQISDVHIGPMRDRRFAREITERVNALEPDLIAVTGDLVDGPVAHLADEVAPFAELRAKHGVFFVTGNHDYYSGADPWLEHVRKLGMRPLRNERVEIRANGAAFDLAGVDDHRGYLFGPGHGEDVPKALAGRNPSRPVVLLAHDPSTFRSASQHDVDLQISGHTHGGQLWPFGYVVRLVVKYVAGEYQRGRSRLFVSRGTGFWGPPMRLGAPPEVVEIVLRSPQRSPLGARADA